MNLILQQLLERLTLELGALIAEQIVSNIAIMVEKHPELVLAGVLLGIAYCMYKHEQQKNLLR